MATTTLRRSKRLKENLESHKVEKTDATKPAKTRAQNESPISVSKSEYVAGPRGHLQQMTEIPLDTLLEILRHLDPMDLLNISWANKNLNIVVMEKSARHIWKESFERLYESDIPPPRCPEDLNLAQYARFLFYHKCAICEKGDGLRTSWQTRLRVCLKCLDGHHFIRSFSEIYKYPVVFNKNATYYLAADVKRGALKSPEERLEFLASREKGEAAFLVWDVRHSEILREVVKLDRQNAILAKLEGLGWKESEITEMYGGGFPADLAGFWVAKKLTDADWKKIKPKILRQLRAKRQKLVQQKLNMYFRKRWQEFKEKFNEWTKAQKMYPCLLPRIADIAVMEPFRSIIFESDAESVEFELDEIDRVAKEWIESRNEFIFSLLPYNLQERYRAAQFEEAQFLSWDSLNRLTFQRRQCFPRLLELCEDRQYYGKRFTLRPEDQKICRMLPGTLPWNWTNEGLEFSSEYKGAFKSRSYR